ncbi:hypothetical protein GPECTOR_2g1120 [Gonium pectorale]|uniref:Uncharacterized protein n=1 Tax=Gonium pectorale TaxID=33097 RepID=A0A150H0F8_GONPE|nr:hypothetical protein GPECTOR_2g1120 [Gonium pectorale]|eukprot:KXZ55571.1 hypothetical protein GPECTOR_2g1120 [Gonium pectorale]
MGRERGRKRCRSEIETHGSPGDELPAGKRRRLLLDGGHAAGSAENLHVRPPSLVALDVRPSGRSAGSGTDPVAADSSPAPAELSSATPRVRLPVRPAGPSKAATDADPMPAVGAVQDGSGEGAAACGLLAAGGALREAAADAAADAEAEAKAAAEAVEVPAPQAADLGAQPQRRAALVAAVLAAMQAAQRLKLQHPRAPAGVLRGFMFEIHHAASFSLAAVRAGSPLRAEVVERNGADIRVYDSTDPRATLARAQAKTSSSSKARRQLDAAKYDGMIKLVPKGMERPAAGHTSVLSYGGISSVPIDAEAIGAAVSDPDAHFAALLNEP